MRTLTIALSVALGAFTMWGQTPYSESVPYVPRPEMRTARDKKDPVVKEPIDGRVVPKSLSIAASVMDLNGVYRIDLKKSDFRVWVGGTEAEIKSFETESGPLNVVLLVDTSPSATVKTDGVKRTANLIADQFRPDDRIMVAGFSSRLKILTELTTDRAQVKKAIKGLSMDDGTLLYDSVRELFDDRLMALGDRTVVFLITDGVDTVSRKDTYLSSVASVERGHALVFPVYLDTFPAATGNVGRLPGTIGNSDAIITLIDNLRKNGYGTGYKSPEDMRKAYDVGRFYLNDLVFASGGRAITAASFAATPAQVATQARQRYFLTVQLPAEMKPGERYPIRVRVNSPNVAVMARGSFIP